MFKTKNNKRFNRRNGPNIRKKKTEEFLLKSIARYLILRVKFSSKEVIKNHFSESFLKWSIGQVTFQKKRVGNPKVDKMAYFSL